LQRRGCATRPACIAWYRLLLLLLLPPRLRLRLLLLLLLLREPHGGRWRIRANRMHDGGRDVREGGRVVRGLWPLSVLKVELGVAAEQQRRSAVIRQRGGLLVAVPVLGFFWGGGLNVWETGGGVDLVCRKKTQCY
jgi:hypothetical protein